MGVMGQVQTPATEQSPQEHDRAKVGEQITQHMTLNCVLGFVYYKWMIATPLIVQMVVTPLRLLESELARIHLFGDKTVERPFAKPPSMFGAAAEADAAIPEEMAEPEIESKEEPKITEIKEGDDADELFSMV